MTRPLYWSIRRELWENRSIYIAPAAVAMFVLFAFLISSIGLPERRRALLSAGDESKAHLAIAAPYDASAVFLIVAVWLVGAWYCIEGLHSERRDRSILFWKSLPVSDLTAVLAKIAIPLLVLPPIIFVFVVVTHLVMASWTGLILIAHGMSPFSTFVYVHFVQGVFVLVYGLIVLALWHAPVYAWLLLLSAWAKRATLLWAILPPAAVSMFERIVFGSARFSSWIQWRLLGGVSHAFIKSQASIDSFSQPTPLQFLATPGLWLGLLAALAFVVAAAYTRRYREPM